MENKPQYHFSCQIVDEVTGEIVMTKSAMIPNEKRTNTPVLGLEDLSEEAAETAFWDMMRHFRNGGQEKYEKENYQIDEENSSF